MKLLLDTSAFIWTAWQPEKLSVRVQHLFKDKQNTCYLSHISLWEMTIKYRLGKMPFPDEPRHWVENMCKQSAIDLMPISVTDIYALSDLPLIHGDPFDRMLIAQAIANGMTLLTRDREIAKYAVPVAW